MAVTVKVADQPWEIEQIHRLNYRTFVEEIPQHRPNPKGRLVDKFHAENCYLICLQDEQLVGMMAVRDKRPFSLDAKLDKLNSYLPPHTSLFEIRLLAVVPQARGTHVLVGLMLMLQKYAQRHGHDLAVMSGTVRQQKLYDQMGFQPFGPLVGEEAARFQPMYLTLEAGARTHKRIKRLAARLHFIYPENEPLP